MGFEMVPPEGAGPSVVVVGLGLFVGLGVGGVGLSPPENRSLA